MFQFENLLWNRSQIVSPFYPPRIIGIEKKHFYALWDLLVLLIVFFHRLVNQLNRIMCEIIFLLKNTDFYLNVWAYGNRLTYRR